jgi:hypothetical protein
MALFGNNNNSGASTDDKDKVFVCVEDCIYKSKRYRRGDEWTGRECPPHFIVKALSEAEDKK